MMNSSHWGLGSNQRLDRLRLAPVVTAGLIGLGGNILSSLFGGGKQTQTQNQNSTTTGSSTPTFDPRFAPLLQMLLGRTQSQLSRGTSLPPGFETNAVERVNKAFAGTRANAENALTARGLSSSPIAASVIANSEQARGGALGDLATQIPLLEREFQQQDLGNALSILGLGRGQSTTSRTQGTGTSTGQTSTSPIDGLGALLADIYFQQTLPKK